jgi:hypothetical protein
MLCLYLVSVGRDSSVGIVTCNGLDDPDRIPVGGNIFLTRPDRAWDSPASYTMGTGTFPAVKRQGRGVDHPPHLSPRLKKEYS